MLWSVEESDGIVVATYMNPPMNYMVAPAVAELAELVADWEREAVRAVILTGSVEGRFITHYSVEELAEMAQHPEAEMQAVNRGYQDFVLRLRRLAKPVIMAMNGDTMGGGFELAMGADIRILQAGDHRVGLPEVRLGILPGGGGTQLLPRLIGLAKASEFILRGRIVTPDVALALGLVHEVVPDALARARDIAADLSRQSGYAIAKAKQALYSGFDAAIETGVLIESDAFCNTMRSARGQDRMRAYLAHDFEARRATLESD